MNTDLITKVKFNCVCSAKLKGSSCSLKEKVKALWFFTAVLLKLQNGVIVDRVAYADW